MNTKTERNPNIVIIKDIDVFGFKIKSSDLEKNINSDIYIGKNVIIYRIYDNKTGNELSIPIISTSYKKTQIEFLDEICRLNTGHSSYEEYNKSKCN